MSDPKNDPIKAQENIIINICDACKTRYSLAEAKKKNMFCCGQRLTEKSERIPMPMGP